MNYYYNFLSPDDCVIFLEATDLSHISFIVIIFSNQTFLNNNSFCKKSKVRPKFLSPRIN